MYDIDIEKKHAELITLLEEVLGEPRKHYGSKGQVSFDCPTCSAMKGLEHDGKGNLEVNYDMGVYNCWSCAETHGTKGKIYNLFKEFANGEQIKRFIAGKFVFTGDYYDSIKEFIPQKESLKLPDEYYSLSGKQKYRDFKPAFSYLYSRGITDEMIDKFKIGFCIGGKYQNRVVIPSYDKDGNLNYFITRSISKYTKKFKYLNPDEDKTEIIFNEHLIDWTKPVFLVEGAFDHIVVPNSIPLLGKKLYEKLFTAIYFNSKSFIIIVLDPDAYEDAVGIFNKLNAGKLRKRVYLNMMPQDHDVSSFNQIYGQEELKKWLKTRNYMLND
jgi:DNA primase